MGDVTDLFMAGAESITIRTKRFPAEGLGKIKEMTENKVYLGISLDDKAAPEFLTSQVNNIEGVVIIGNKKQTELYPDTESFLKKIANTNKLFVVESQKDNISYWERLGATGVMHDFSKVMEGA
jgi:hypothetical protein